MIGLIIINLSFLCFVFISFYKLIFMQKDTPIQKIKIKRKLNTFSEWEVWKFEKKVIKDIMKLCLSW